MSNITTVMNAVTAQVGKMVEVMTPIAKQAYETGLLVIRIDGLATLVPAVLTLLFSTYLIRKFYVSYKQYRDMATAHNAESPSRWEKDFTHYAPVSGMFIIFGGALSAIAAGISIITLLNVWLWVQVFIPQLWLAHEAMLTLLAKAL